MDLNISIVSSIALTLTSPYTFVFNLLNIKEFFNINYCSYYCLNHWMKTCINHCIISLSLVFFSFIYHVFGNHPVYLLKSWIKHRKIVYHIITLKKLNLLGSAFRIIYYNIYITLKILICCSISTLLRNLVT